MTADEATGAPRTLGATTVNYTATPAQSTYEVPWSVELPAELDKKDFSGRVALTLVVRGYNALHGFTVPDDTNLTVPTYTASFDRRVEIAVDDGPFAADGVTLAADGATWSATIPTPEVGSHTIKARAVQGLRTSPPATRTIAVIQ